MNGQAVFVLGVLNEEYHKKRDDGGARVDDQLPSIAIVKKGPCDEPHHNDERGDDETNGSAGDVGGSLRQAFKIGFAAFAKGYFIWLDVEIDFFHGANLIRT